MHSLSSLKPSLSHFTSITRWTNNEMRKSATADVTPPPSRPLPSPSLRSRPPPPRAPPPPPLRGPRSPHPRAPPRAPRPPPPPAPRPPPLRGPRSPHPTAPPRAPRPPPPTAPPPPPAPRPPHQKAPPPSPAPRPPPSRPLPSPSLRPRPSPPPPPPPGSCTEDYVVSGERSISNLSKNIIEAITDTNTHKMGVCGKHDTHMTSLLVRVRRVVTRDRLFYVTVMVSIGKNPDLTRIQQEIARELGLRFQGQGKGKDTAFSAGSLGVCGIGSGSKKKYVDENAGQLYDWIRKKPKILLILCDLRERIDLKKIGIPSGAVHPGCKLILTSGSEEGLTHQMKTQPTIKVPCF